MAGFFKGLLRANAALYGDVEGSITELKRGKRSITIEKGQVVLWIVGENDIVLTKDDIEALEPISSNQMVKDLASGGGKLYSVNVYNLILKNGRSGIMRLVSGSEYKVLSLIKLLCLVSKRPQQLYNCCGLSGH
jgi:hypothetical protein